jgi:hypothetical protein
MSVSQSVQSPRMIVLLCQAMPPSSAGYAGPPGFEPHVVRSQPPVGIRPML